jgi:hypothetical protein
MSIDQYLARHAQPEVALERTIERTYDNVIVVPAYDERSDFVDDLDAATRDHACLVIVVVNATDDAPGDAHAANSALLAALTAVPDILAVDRASSGCRLPAKQGVGLARRIGCDVALALSASGKLLSPWIHMTDADAVLPVGYFAATREVPGDVVALTYPFEHVAPEDPALATAAAAYDDWLRYYVLGLRSAGSPYAFHSIGSTIAVRADAYAAVRGVPLREAGEDFYFLNKLAKLGPIAEPPAEAIRLSSRTSHRVPFGTGPGIAKFAAALAAGDEPSFYDPRSFAALGSFLTALEDFACSGTLSLPDDGPLAAVAAELDAPAALRKAREATTSSTALRRRAHEWFDGFRSRQLIHALRHHGHPDLPMAAALDAAPFWPPPAAG